MNKICEYCGKTYFTEDRDQKYCCRAHANLNRKSHKITVICKNCGKEKEIFPSRFNTRKNYFCNKECHDTYQKTLIGTKTAGWKGSRLARVCEYCKRTYKPAKCLNNKNGPSKFCSNKCRLEDLFEHLGGENHPSWKGGITPFRRKVESSQEYKQWRISVFKRDKYQCVLCGKNRDICAHHIKTFADYSDLRMSVNNGITLCDGCHRKTYSREADYEDYFDNLVSFINEFSSREVRIAIA